VVGSCLVGGQRHLIVSDDGLEGDVPETEHSAVEVLTRRELQVALMVCEGLINKQIANRLGLSRWTIESYIRRACFKLGVKNRAALVARLISNIAPGISPDAPPD
jgi:DNA-binding CsgD family transcriptional regulator